jgi:hypothetical protein
VFCCLAIQLAACGGSITEPNAEPEPPTASFPQGDVFSRPFAFTSPWNRPLSDYVAVTYQPTAALRTLGEPAFSAFSPWLQANWVTVQRAQPTDPVVGIYYHPDAWSKVASGAWQRWGNTPAVEAEIRRGMTQTWAGYEGNMYSTVDPLGYQMPAIYKRRQDPYWSLTAHVPATALFASYTDPTGDGTGSAHGRRASMVPAYGGVIRRGELAYGRIDHALCLALGPEALAREIRWPATAMDRNPTDYAGTLPMGTLLALPPNVDVDALARTREGRIVARAAQRYGAYVVDRSGPRAFVLCTEHGAEDVPLYSAALESDLRWIRDALQIVIVP